VAPSNEALLLVAFVSFFTIWISSIGRSNNCQVRQMMDDCAAKWRFDVMTIMGLNLVAERKKKMNWTMIIIITNS
jgi:hypothetical protein